MNLDTISALIPLAAGGNGEGILDWITLKLGDVRTLFRTVALVGGMGFVIWQAILSKGALSRIIVSGIAAGVFVWIVFNVTSLEERIGNEMNAVPPVASASMTP